MVARLRFARLRCRNLGVLLTNGRSPRDLATAAFLRPNRHRRLLWPNHQPSRHRQLIWQNHHPSCHRRLPRSSFIEENWNGMDLNLKSLGFRLFRQHGYHIPQEIFEDIKDETGNIKAHIGEDIVGMLNLYEASFHAIEDENILDEAREFTTKCLKEELEKKKKSMINVDGSYMWMLVSHALDLPLHWTIPRFEALWFIEAYKKRSDMKPVLLELAKLDFNVLQGIHQEDLKYSSRWWDDLAWNKKLSFARDRLVESFMWSVGSRYEPSFGVVRRNITKLISLVNVIDDAYDVYGTLDELEQFTQVVKSLGALPIPLSKDGRMKKEGIKLVNVLMLGVCE